MRKAILVIAAILVAVSASAQVGIVGGITSSATRIKNVDVKNLTQFHAGLTYKFPFALGFAIQPELLYNVKGGKFQAGGDLAEIDTKTGFLEAGAQFQWGFNLDEVHPYLFAEPFVGYALNSSVSGEKITDWSGVNRFEYGLGLGFGVELIKHVQISAQYFWNLGKLYNEDGTVQASAFKAFSDALKSGNVNGITISAAILF